MGVITGGARVAWHPVGSKVAINPATIAAAFKVFLRFAFIDCAFQLRVHNYFCSEHHERMLSLGRATRKGFIKFVSNKFIPRGQLRYCEFRCVYNRCAKRSRFEWSALSPAKDIARFGI